MFSFELLILNLFGHMTSSSSPADEDICKLYCIAEDFDFFFAMSSKVKDGTSCSDLTPDVCIDGVCEVQGERSR